jgi:hypothetical protein
LKRYLSLVFAASTLIKGFCNEWRQF